MKSIILKNRFTLLASCLAVYFATLVLEGLITNRQPELLRFDNSLFELNILELRELGETFD